MTYGTVKVGSTIRTKVGEPVSRVNVVDNKGATVVPESARTMVESRTGVSSEWQEVDACDECPTGRSTCPTL